MPRILGVDIPNDKRTVISLRYIYGIGPHLADQLCERTGISPDKRARDLSEDELATLNEYRAEVYAPLDRTLTYAKDLANLRKMAQASDIMYDANRHDAAIAAGDPSVIGASIDRRKAAGEFDDRMQVALGVWNIINEKIPAPILKHWQQIGVLLDAPSQLVH